MSWIVLIIIAVIIAVAMIACMRKMEYPGDVMLWLIGAAIVWTICAFVMCANHLGRDYSRRACYEYATETDRDVRFIQVGYWSWDCFVQTDIGWVKTSQIMKIEDEER